MAHPETGGALPPDQQMVFDADVGELREAGEKYGVGGLEGRVKYGLDPAAMMVNRETKPLAEGLAKSFGTSAEKVWPFIKALHEQGPWRAADRLSASDDPEAKTYLVLAAACHEAGREGYTPEQYMQNRAQVVADLGSFSLDQLEARKQDLRGRVKNLELVRHAVGGREVTVPVAEGDVALPLAMDGYRGCVSKAGDAYFAQTAEIPDTLLEAEELVPGFGEKFNPSTGTFERVEASTPGARLVWVAAAEAGKPIPDMQPAVKRIAPGYVLTYGNKDLAVDLVAKATALA
jgi:hypothetical protein